MKKWVGILLFVFSFSYAQNDTIKSIGVVAAERMNVVYRGVANPITISVSNCKSFTASAPGLTKISEGYYRLTPGVGLEVNVILTIVQFDGSVLTEKHPFIIKNIPKPIALFNGRNCRDCIVKVQRSEFKDAIISVDTGVEFNLNFDVKQFSVYIPNQKAIVIFGNKFDSIHRKLTRLKSGTEILISDIRYGPDCDSCDRTSAASIRIKVIDDIIPFFKTKKFLNDSLQNIKTQRKLELKEKKK
ncbi:GldM family protein [Flavobacterium sp. 3HN19-14]|uniref:GldM family protein n=1 Tax=Flavobacterium sp. 3HN19-14 TaxID=3448133 RepID=UPI003EDE7BC4